MIFIEGVSMQPTFNKNPARMDLLLTTPIRFSNRSILFPSNVERGAVVTVELAGHDLVSIKRIIALENDMVLDRKGFLHVVPEGSCWIEGDSFNSIDSNTFGTVRLGQIRSKVWAVAFPLKPARLLKSAIPQEKLERLTLRPR